MPDLRGGELRRVPQRVHNSRWINGKIEEDEKTEGKERRMREKKGRMQEEGRRRESEVGKCSVGLFLGDNVTRPGQQHGFHGPQWRYSGFQGGIC